MIEEQATVVRIEGDDAWVETQRQSSCSACSASKGCGTSVLSNVLGKRINHVRVLNSIDVKPGDQVIIGVEEQSLVRGSIAVYLVPLVSMFSLALFADWFAKQQNWGQHDLAAIIGAVIGFGLGLSWLKRFSRKIYRDKHYQPVIIRKISRTSEVHLNIIPG